jgi:hypothetical protein
MCWNHIGYLCAIRLHHWGTIHGLVTLFDPINHVLRVAFHPIKKIVC